MDPRCIRHHVHQLVSSKPHASLYMSGMTRFASCRLLSGFFRAGQVIETFRGKGVYQLAVEEAIQKLNNARWVSTPRAPACLPTRLLPARN